LQLFWLKTCSMSNMCRCPTLTQWLHSNILLSQVTLTRCLQYLVNIHQCL
jgi:hypothetical protein